jgi:hypothetical protein
MRVAKSCQPMNSVPWIMSVGSTTLKKIGAQKSVTAGVLEKDSIQKKHARLVSAINALPQHNTFFT